jgi:hypothetical protein
MQVSGWGRGAGSVSSLSPIDYYETVLYNAKINTSGMKKRSKQLGRRVMHAHSHIHMYSTTSRGSNIAPAAEVD